MRIRRPFVTAALIAAAIVLSFPGRAQSAPATTAQRALAGLAPFSALLQTEAGRGALSANLARTGAIQTGTSGQHALQPFPQQQTQALKDATITDANAVELADGLGSALGRAYAQLGSCTSTDDGPAYPTCTIDVPTLGTLLAYTSRLTATDANAGKFAFSNASTGVVQRSDDAAAAIAAVNGTTDVLGKTYLPPVCRSSVDGFGDPRPFQTQPQFRIFWAVDYFGKTKSNQDYLCGPIQDLRQSPSFPSGHTTFGYTESVLLAILVPERYAEMIARAAEYGNSRLIVGAHYTMDVIGGRTLAEYDVAHLLAGDPAYLGQKFGSVPPIAQYRDALAAAAKDLRRELATRCGAAVAVCAHDDQSRFRDDAISAAFYESTLTYGLPIVYPARAGAVEDVAAIAPEAGYLLTAAFPKLSLAQADRILTATEGPGGGFLDNGSAFGVYSRLDLFRAAREAARL
jgi:membrane-associated phospholipid phosphatase